MSYTKYGPGCAEPSAVRDMFDFLEDAGRRLDQAARDLAEREMREVFGRTSDEIERDRALVVGLRRELDL